MLLEFVCLEADFIIDTLHFILMSISFSVQAKLYPEGPNLSNARGGITSIDRALATPTGTKSIVEDVP